MKPTPQQTKEKESCFVGWGVVLYVVVCVIDYVTLRGCGGFWVCQLLVIYVIYIAVSRGVCSVASLASFASLWVVCFICSHLCYM